jgi:SAM-dependent methyltransferase
MTTRQDKVRAYYAAFDEWERLDSPAGALELARTLQILDQQLPASSRVLDLGGGPGRYAIELARRGHRVVLADLSPALLEQARTRIAASGMQRQIESVDEVNAEDLGRYDGESFDAVLALGPFYHLVAEEERERAAREIARVLRPAGRAFVAFVPRISGIAGLIERAARRPDQVSAESLRVAAETGVFRNAADSGFQEGYYPHVAELEGLLTAVGLEIADAVSLRSIAYRLELELGALDTSTRSEVERWVTSMSRWPEIVATSGHALLIARRPARSAD